MKKYIELWFISLVCAGLIVLVSITIDGAIRALNNLLVPCQHGTVFSKATGQCECTGTPFDGVYCGKCKCANGFCSSSGGTTPRITSDYGCQCPYDSKFFGFLCDRCHASNKTTCTGECDDGFYGSRCNRKCFEEISYSNTLGGIMSDRETTCNTLRANGGTCSPCSGHGTCEDGRCVCFNNWFDDGPSLCAKTCAGEDGVVCSGHGICKLYGTSPTCRCSRGWRGESCSIECPGTSTLGSSCNGHGSCSVDYGTTPPTAECACSGNWLGDACDIFCPGNNEPCSGHGTCDVSSVGSVAECTCDISAAAWTGTGCNCSDALTCNNRGTCDTSGKCICDGTFAGKNCNQCKEKYYGSSCQLFCDGNSPTSSGGKGCNGRGSCTLIDVNLPSETVACTCFSDEVRKRVGRKVKSFYSVFDPNNDCADCLAGYFPKVDVFESYNTDSLGLYVPCQVQCHPSTCNGLGKCNDLYGKPGEPLCTCDNSNGKHLNGSSFCTKCEDNWFPDNIKQADGCTNFCVSDLAFVGGTFPSICEDGDIECVDCGGNGVCNEDGKCSCRAGFTGDSCQMKCESTTNDLVCGGHGVCETSELQKLLQYEFDYLENSGPASTCICDPQDIYTDEDLKVANRTIPTISKEYFGETCDFHCEKPPWVGSENCNGLGKCTTRTITDPNDNTFSCTADADCRITAVERITSLDSRWNSVKGPFCHKRIEACTDSGYTSDDCVKILSLQRPVKTRSRDCVSNATCRNVLDQYDWHQWCTTRSDTSNPFTRNCGDVSYMCPVRDISDECQNYVSMSTGSTISAHMDYCYENDFKRYPFKMTNVHRLNGPTAELHGDLSDQMMKYAREHPGLNIDISGHCGKRRRKFEVEINEVATNERYTCGSKIVSRPEDCVYNKNDLGDLWTPFSVHCPSVPVVKYTTLVDAINARGSDCTITEDEDRHVVPNPGQVEFGNLCYKNSDCLSSVCHGNTCCGDFHVENCVSCNNIGQCGKCADGTTWNGTMCHKLVLSRSHDDYDAQDAADALFLKRRQSIVRQPPEKGLVEFYTEHRQRRRRLLEAIPFEYYEDTSTHGDLSFSLSECALINTNITGATRTTFSNVYSGKPTGCYKYDGMYSYNYHPTSSTPCSVEYTCIKKVESVSSTTEPPTTTTTEPPTTTIGATGVYDIVTTTEPPTTTEPIVVTTTPIPSIPKNTQAGLALIEATCNAAVSTFPTCNRDFANSTCAIQYNNFNWLQYCRDNNPVLTTLNFGSELLEKNAISNLTISVPSNTTFIHYWVQPTSIFSTSTPFEVTSTDGTLARVMLHQGQIQLNELSVLESCPNDNTECLQTWGYEPNQWYRLELMLDFENKQVRLTYDTATVTKPFLCSQNDCNPTKPSEAIIAVMNTETYYDEIVFEQAMPNPSLFNACLSSPYCDVNVNYRKICSDTIRKLQFPLLVEPKHDIVDTCASLFYFQSFEEHDLSSEQQETIKTLDWDKYCTYFDAIDDVHDCQGYNYSFFENYTDCRDILEPVSSSTECMQATLDLNWTSYCNELALAKVPLDIQHACPKKCYKKLESYSECDERASLFSDNTNVINSACSADVVPFCKQVAASREPGVCAAVECDCDTNKYEGVAGTSCELQCPIAGDGSACGEASGVGKCDYTAADKETLKTGIVDDEGNFVAFSNRFEIKGQCDCFLSEGNSGNCDQLCLHCNESVYNEAVYSPSEITSWSSFKNVQASNNVYIGSPNPASISTGGEFVLDLDYPTVVVGIVMDADVSLTSFNISTSSDGVYFAKVSNYSNVRMYGRFVKVHDVKVSASSATFRFGVKISRSGQVGACNGGTGTCDCLPPFTTMIYPSKLSWQGSRSNRVERHYNLPEEYNAEDEFRIRAMQGKETFVKTFLKKDSILVFSEGDEWGDIYRDFRDNPSNYECLPGSQCTFNDFSLLGTLAGSSFRFNYDCNSECEGIDPRTFIPCSGHGSCRATGQCVCDPASIVVGVNKVTGVSTEIDMGNGKVYESSDIEISQFDRSGWRGSACDVMCPGYDPTTRSMLSVCSGHGICDKNGECACSLGYIGDACQFECPGFDGDKNICSGHGTCELSLLEISYIGNTTVLYDGICSGFTYHGVVSSTLECVETCNQQDITTTGTVHSVHNDCFCSKIDCPDEDVKYSGNFVTYIKNEITASGNVAKDCEYTWSTWGACDGNRETRTLIVTQESTYGGLECPMSPEYRSCSIAAVDCGGSWSPWSACDGVYQHRNLTISQEPNGGLACPISPEVRLCCVDCDLCPWVTTTVVTSGVNENSVTQSVCKEQSAYNDTFCSIFNCTDGPSGCVSVNTLLDGVQTSLVYFSEESSTYPCTDSQACIQTSPSAIEHVDGTCHCPPGYMYTGSLCSKLALRSYTPRKRLRSNHGDCSSPTSCSTFCLLECCPPEYLDISNCMECDENGEGMNTYELYSGNIFSSRMIVAVDNSYDATVLKCNTLDECSGIYYNVDDDQWLLGSGIASNINTTGLDFVSYKKSVLPDSYCKQCIPGSIWSIPEKRCVPLPCPSGQVWENDKGCIVVKSSVAKSIQESIARGLVLAKCGEDAYVDRSSKLCLKSRDHPMINVTFGFGEDELTVGCEVWGATKVKCPRCDCYADNLFGMWSSLECSTCAKGYSNEQCKQMCPGYDGSHDESMCNSFGICDMGSEVVDGIRTFRDASCTCGNPPAKLVANNQMQIFNNYYKPFVTVTQPGNLVQCLDSSHMIQTGRDMCYHFDDQISDCSRCELGFTGKNCQYLCDKCLMGGSCSNAPSDIQSAGCICKDLFGIPGVLWTFNCCPVGFRVSDSDAFNVKTQSQLDNIALTAVYNPDTTSQTDADFWCKPCPGVESSDWLQTGAQYKVCGGISRGECQPKDATSNKCRCLPDNGGAIGDPTKDWTGPSCRCNKHSVLPFVNLATDYGCTTRHLASITEGNNGATDAPPDSMTLEECEVQDGLLSQGTKAFQSADFGNLKPHGCFFDGDHDLMFNTHAIEHTASCSEQTKCAQLAHQLGGECLKEIGEVTVDGNTIRYACSLEDGFYWTSSGNVASRVGTHIPSGYFYTTDLPTTDCSYGSNFEGKPCSRCNSGHYQDQTGQNTCKICPAGQYTPITGIHVSCLQCNIGTTSLPGAWVCTGCNNGKYSVSPAVGCVDCGVGTYTPNDDNAYSVCKDCEAGKYEPSTGMSVCSTCPGGKYTDTTGQTVCKTCLSGHYCPGLVGFFTYQSGWSYGLMQQCGMWSVSDAGAESCKSCAAGYYGMVNGVPSTVASTCGECSAGKYATWKSNQLICESCATGKYGGVSGNRDDWQTCKNCPTGQYAANTGSSSCTNCDNEHCNTGTANTGCRTRTCLTSDISTGFAVGCLGHDCSCWHASSYGQGCKPCDATKYAYSHRNSYDCFCFIGCSTCYTNYYNVYANC